MARRSWPALLATAIGLGLVLANRPALAQEPFYKGKTVRLLVNYPAGGATDVVARPTIRAVSPRFFRTVSANELFCQP